jgi:4-hydroxybenzoate polyprenyltransferase
MSQITVAPAWMGWRVALRLGRVSNLPTVWTNVVAGVVLSGGSIDAVPLTLLFVALSLFYVAGMYLNDAFDRNIDSRERPERPIPSGRVSTTSVFAIGALLLLAGEGVLAIMSYGLEGGQGWPPLVAGVALAAAIIYYDMSHKANPVSPVIMGLCRALVYVTAALAVTSGFSSPLFWGSGLMLAYLIGLTYAAKQENLAEVKNVWPLIFLALPFVYAVPAALGSLTTALILVGFLAWVIYALVHLVWRSRINFPLAVGSLLAGISFLDALLISGQGEVLIGLLAVGGVVLTRLAQRYIPGT